MRIWGQGLDTAQLEHSSVVDTPSRTPLEKTGFSSASRNCRQLPGQCCDPSGLNLCTLHTCCQFQWSSVLLYVEDRFLREIDHFWFLRSFPPSSFPETDPEPRGQGYDEDSPFPTVWSKASAHHQTVSLLVSLTIRKSCSDQSQSRHWPVSQPGVIFGIFETVLLDCHGWSQVCPQTWNSSVSASRGLPHYRHRPHAHLNHVLLFCI